MKESSCLILIKNNDTSNETEKDKMVVDVAPHFWGREGIHIHTRVRCGNLKETDYVEDLDSNGRIILKLLLNTRVVPKVMSNNLFVK